MPRKKKPKNEKTPPDVSYVSVHDRIQALAPEEGWDETAPNVPTVEEIIARSANPLPKEDEEE